MNNISAAIHCQLGNNLFQIAQGYAQSKKHDRPFVLFTQNKWAADGNPHLPKFRNNVLAKLNLIDGGVPDTYQAVSVRQEWYEEASPLEGDTIFYGQPQSEKYFKSCAQEIQLLFGPTDDFKNKMYEKYPMLKTSVVTSVQARRGDGHTNQLNRHPVLSADYINEVVKTLPSDYYFMFSNDLEWCRQNLKISKMMFIDESDSDSIWLMSLCHNFSIANSTYGWWGAYLSLNSNKKVVIPECWFGPAVYRDIPTMTTKDLPAEGWVVFPSTFKDGFIIPK